MCTSEPTWCELVLHMRRRKGQRRNMHTSSRLGSRVPKRQRYAIWAITSSRSGFFRKRCPTVIQQGITCSRSRSVQPAPIHTMSSSTTVRVRPRTQTRLYLAYRGCGRLKHGNRCSRVILQPQCKCEHITLITYSTREGLIKACHCCRKGIRIKSRKCRSY